MRKITSAFALLFACIGTLTGPCALAKSGNTASVAGTAGAQVVAPITLVATSSLRFGTIAQPVLGGTITMSPYGTITTTGDLGASTGVAQPTPQGAASFTLTGNPGAQFAIYGVSQVTITNGVAKMTLGQFTTNAVFAIGQLGSNGTASFNIGGTLTVSANQAVGNYSGTFPITVMYY